MKKFLLILAIIFAGNFFASNVQAEIKNYSGRGAALFDFSDEDAKTTETVKNVAKLRAIKQAFEKAGFFVLSYTEETLNGKTTDEYISAIVRDMATIENEKIDKYFFNSEEYNRPGYIYEANLIAKIDTDKIAKYFQLDYGEKQKLIERDQVAKKNFEEIDSEFENLRKTADQKTQAQIKSELEKIDNKISTQNKHAEKNIPMIFSQPVEIGYIGYTPGSPYDREFYIDKASAIKATPAKHKTHYTKGLAYWGTGKDLIYCHFDEGFIKFGDENISNTVEVNPISARIYKVNNSKNKTIYIVDTRWGSASSFWRNFGYDVIGKMDNGKWVKYFSVSGSFNPRTFNADKVSPHPENLICKDDTIIIEFYPNSHDGKKVYEMRYKWDEKAQWFGIEQIKY